MYVVHFGMYVITDAVWPLADCGMGFGVRSSQGRPLLQSFRALPFCRQGDLAACLRNFVCKLWLEIKRFESSKIY